MSVGDDSENGLWAIYGARQGCHMTNIGREDWDWRNVRDFDWLTEFYKSNVGPKFEDGNDQLCPRTGMKWNYKTLQDESNRLGYELRSKLDLEIADLGIEDRRFTLLFLRKYIF